ncbi:MAG: hypothetical protein COA43_07390 [Robiginitomaculum sp.]|nr:MAG: hypothetical protein COA43_07390 [Robiginitomaculum sp.]
MTTDTQKSSKTKTRVKAGTSKNSAARKATRPNRETLISLRAHVDDIEKRLKRANSLTKSSVKALTTSFEQLQVLSGGSQDEDKTQRLASHIDDLSTRLVDLIEQTRTDVAHDLQIVMSDPRMETISAALTKANKRLTRAEAQQASTINSINAQIANLASAIDGRLQREVQARESSHAKLERAIKSSQDTIEQSLNESLGARIDAVEVQSAEAVKTIGEKVVRVSEDIQDRTQEALHHLGEQGLNIQQGYEEHKENIARRIEAIEDDQRNTIPSLERHIVTLSTRLEVLEGSGLEGSATVMSAQVVANIDVPPMVKATPFAYPQTDTSQVKSEPISVSTPQLVQTDAFSPSETVVLANVPPTQSPYTLNDTVADVSAARVGAAQPQEFVPTEFVPTEFIQEVYEAPNIAPVENVAHSTLDEPVQSHAPFNMETGAFEQPNMSNAAPVATHIATPVASEEMAPPPFASSALASSVPPMAVPTLDQEKQADAAQRVADIEKQAETMYAARPGAESAPKGSGFLKGLLSKGSKAKAPKTPKIPKSKNTDAGVVKTGSPLRLGLLMSGVAVVGLLTAKVVLPKIMGGSENGPVQTNAQPAQPPQYQTSENQSRSNQSASLVNQNVQANQNIQANQKVQPQVIAPVIETIAAVGDYSDTMQAPDLGQDSANKPSPQRVTLEAAAGKGEPVAQFQLGLSHLDAGRNQEGLRLIRLAADQGQAAALYRLGKMYEAGIGVETDFERAMLLLEKSAKGGNRIAMHDLGHYHASGAGGAENIELAREWFKKAAERGVLDSQFNLGVLYQDGAGTNKDPIEAYVWFAVAGAQGDKVALQRSELIARDFSAAQLQAAQKRVKAFRPTRINDAANGIFRDLPWSTKAKKNVRSANVTVKNAQEILLSLGYDVGTPDGAMGPRTRNAVMSFERANGMPETGRVNSVLLERLSLMAGA